MSTVTTIATAVVVGAIIVVGLLRGRRRDRGREETLTTRQASREETQAFKAWVSAQKADDQAAAWAAYKDAAQAAREAREAYEASQKVANQAILKRALGIKG